MMAFALSLLSFGKMIAQAVFAWLSRRSLSDILCIIAVSALFIDHIALLSAHRHARKVEAQLSKAVQARLNDRAAYSKAQAAAHVQNIVQVAAKEAQSKKVSDDERQAYLRDLAQLRADDQRLRAQVAAASGAARPAPSSPAPAPASGADADGLPLSSDEHLQAAEIELRLMHLQNWVEQQLAIDPNTPERIK